MVILGRSKPSLVMDEGTELLVRGRAEIITRSAKATAFLLPWDPELELSLDIVRPF